MSKETGGPAFPVVKQTHNDETTEVITATRLNEGMTLRDWFAAKAMQAFISTAAAPCIVGGLDGAESETAKAAYLMADKMLEARK